MSALELLGQLRALGVLISVEGGSIHLQGPPGAVSPELREELRRRKAELLELVGAQGEAAGATEPPLVPTAREHPLPLSSHQERLWRLITRAPDSAAYNLPLAFRLSGALDVPALERSLARIVERHEALRTVFVDLNGEPAQVALPFGGFALSVLDRADEPPTDREVQAWVMAEARAPMDIAAGPLFRMRLMKTGAREYVFTVVMHHIVSDGWSFDVFFDELETAYSAALSGTEPDLTPLTVQYGDYAAWERATVAGRGMELLETYWRERLAGQVEPLRLPSAAGPPAAGRSAAPVSDAGPQAERLRRTLAPGVRERLEALGAEQGATLFVVAAAGLVATLKRLTGQEDLVFVTPSAGRSQAPLEGLIGYFNNLLPLRVAVADDPTVAELLVRVRDATMGAFKHQAYPFERLLRHPNLTRTSLARAMIALHPEVPRRLTLSGIEVRELPVFTGAANFDLGLSVEATGSGLEAVLTVKREAFGADEAEHFLEAFLETLDALPAALDRRLSELLGPAGPGDGRPSPDAAPATPRLSRDGASWVRHAPLARDASAVPRDPLEIQLILIWERVLDARPIAPGDDFFELGGHSLLAVRLLEEIEAELDRTLPLSALIEHPTVEALARALRDEGWEPSGESLVAMQPHGAEPPIHVLHSYEGHVFFFNDLARSLAPDQPVYGLQAVGLDGSCPPLASVESMAEHYLRLVRTVQCSGPYTIVAMCFGVSVGLEMAQRLHGAGEDVQLVILDGGFPALLPPTASPSLPRRLVRRVRNHARGLQSRASRALRYLRASPYVRRELRMRASLIRAWYGYQPLPFEGTVTLIRCEDTASDPANDWHLVALDALAAGEKHIVSVAGHHFSMLHPPHVQALSDRIREVLAHRAVGAG